MCRHMNEHPAIHCAQEAASTRKNLPGLRAPIQLAKEVGQGLGLCPLLQPPLPT